MKNNNFPSLRELLDGGAAKYGDAPFIKYIQNGNIIEKSYSTVCADSKAVCRMLRAFSGEKIHYAIIGKTSYDYLIFFSGIIISGNTGVPFSPEISVNEAAELFRRADIQGLIYDGEFADRNKLEPKHFAKWVEYAKARGLGIDFNPTFFSHKMVVDGLTLSSPIKEVRDFWIEHGIACLRIAEYFADETGIPCLLNYWMPDGLKDYPADRQGPRQRMKDSLDKIFAAGYDKSKVIPTLESKVFGIGVEAYTVGSAEFCLSYSMKNGITPLVDNGHYHPTEMVSDKISSLLLFSDKMALHITRPMRWDSDHVVSYDDETREIMKEVVRCGLDRVFIATDYFDASINRISAWVTGLRNTQKALLYALLEPQMAKYQDEADFTSLQVCQEAYKLMPIVDIWNEFLAREGVESDYLKEIKKYEAEVLSKRV